MIKISVIVPAYNEEGSIIECLTMVNAQRKPLADYGFDMEVIIVDDGSSDQTVAVLERHEELYEQLIKRPVNGGKGAAVQTGLRVATGEYILFQDADLEYDPSEYYNLLVPVKKFNADLVIGSRTIAPRYLKVHYFGNRVGNVLITLTLNMLYNRTFTDIYSCYLMFRRSLIDPEALRTFGFDQQAEILAKCLRKSKSMYEVPISYHGRTYEEGKKIRPTDIFPTLWTIFRSRAGHLKDDLLEVAGLSNRLSEGS